MPLAAASDASVAGPKSPQPKSSQGAPVPATVVITPDGSMRRTRRRPESAMYSDRSRPTARPVGVWSSALVAGPPSPQGAVAAGHRVPGVPATIAAGPSPSTRRMVRSSKDAKYPCSDSLLFQVGGAMATTASGAPTVEASNSVAVLVGHAPPAEGEHGAGIGGASVASGSRWPWQPVAEEGELPSGHAVTLARDTPVR